MSESFANKPPSNPDKDTFYTMGGLQDIADFIGSAEQIAQLYPGEQNRPEYEPGLSDLRYTRSFKGAEPGGSFYSPSGAGNAPAPFQEQIVYQQPMIQPGGDGAFNEAVLASLLNMDWSGAYEDYINKLESQRDITNFMPNFDYSPSFDPTFNPSYSPSTNISNVVSPSITQNPSIEVNPNITNTLEQTQQQTMGGGSKTGQTQGGGFDFGLGDDSLFDADIGFADDGGALDSDFFTNVGAGSGARTSKQDDQLFEADLGLPSTDFGATNYRSTVGLNTASPVINQSPSIVVSPTISNVLKQQQAQWMGGGGQRPTTSISVSVSRETSVETSIPVSIVTSVVTSIGTSVPTSIVTSIDTSIPVSIPTSAPVSVPTSAPVSVSTSVPVSLTASEETVKGIYKGLFDREDVDAEGLDYWSSKLDAGTPLETLIRQIAGGAQGEDRSKLTPNEAERYIERLDVDTPEERNDFITEAYQDLFERTPDAEGRAYWNRELEQGKTPTEILRDLTAGAQETDAAFLRNTKTVNDLYRDLLGREADAEGREYFRSQLEAGATPEDVARNLISGAKAGSEASEISQAEYDRYFKQPEDTSTPTQNSVDSLVNSLNTQSLESLYSTMQDGRQAIADIKDLATQYANGMILTPGITPQQFRDGFLTELAASRPDLLTQMVGDTIANQYTMEYYGGEGSTPTTGTDVRGLADEIVKRANDPDYVKAALQLASIYGGFGGTGSGAAGTDSGLSSTASGAAGIGGQGAGLVALAESLINGDDAAKTFSNVATSIAVTAILQATGPIGQTIYVLDSILAKEFGYDSPIQESVLAFAKLTEKGADWVIDKVSEIFGGAFDSISDVFNSVGDFLNLAEGGLVDLPGDSMYNANTQGVLPDIEGYARGGIIPLPGGGKIAKGPGGGLDDLIPTSIDGRRAAALSDGEFVIPADVVSMMGDGSTNAGSKRLYDLVRQVRQEKTGTSRQAGPLQVGKILERTMR